MEEAAKQVDAQQAKTAALLKLKKAKEARDITKNALQQKQGENAITNRYGVGYAATADAQISALKNQLAEREDAVVAAQSACNAVACEEVSVSENVTLTQKADGTIVYGDDSLPWWVYVLIAVLVIGSVIAVVWWFLIRDKGVSVLPNVFMRETLPTVLPPPSAFSSPNATLTVGAIVPSPVPSAPNMTGEQVPSEAVPSEATSIEQVSSATVPGEATLIEQVSSAAPGEAVPREPVSVLRKTIVEPAPTKPADQIPQIQSGATNLSFPSVAGPSVAVSSVVVPSKAVPSAAVQSAPVVSEAVPSVAVPSAPSITASLPSTAVIPVTSSVPTVEQSVAKSGSTLTYQPIAVGQQSVPPSPSI